MAKFKENFIKWFFTIAAFASLVFLVGIIIVLFKEARKFSYSTFSSGNLGIPPMTLRNSASCL
ncbi:MAG: hypothetical protein NT079_03920 [Candidatus Omnitrophica bacterium]|nr:hypothetical protein [Candidatus Omnitrophota bacterium]